MAHVFRASGSVALVALVTATAAAATPQQIDAATQKGVAYLKQRFKDRATHEDDRYRVGPAALAGIALLEADVPRADPSLKVITDAVREAAYRETKTYYLALYLILLDKLEDPADGYLIQALAVRLLAGQTPQGGWGYDCVDTVPANDEQLLRAGAKEARLTAGKPREGGTRPAGKLHPDIEKYAAAVRARRVANQTDDNSNTQFAVIAVWAARKHGVPVEFALDLVDKRFLATQLGSGGWGYQLKDATSFVRPSMCCAGLLGLSTGLARREERRLKVEPEKPTPAPAPPLIPPTARPDDPFFNPPKVDAPAAKPNPPKLQPDARDIAIGRGLVGLGQYFAGVVRQPDWFSPGGGNFGDRDLYFLWSLERVAVIYGLDKIGGVDWYAVGADAVVKKQNPDGSWPSKYHVDADASFAVLFLVRANIAKDLSLRVQQKAADTELRAGAGPGANTTASVPNSPAPVAAFNPLPLPDVGEASKLAANLLRAPEADWKKALDVARDAKGADHTTALVLVIHRVDGEKRKQARDALAERLTRMSADTLRGMAKGDDAELRRGAVLACAMRDDKDHVPDLIERLTDDEELVVRAARAGLKSLTAQDFGPAAGATTAQRKAAADAWQAWWAKQKK